MPKSPSTAGEPVRRALSAVARRRSAAVTVCRTPNADRPCDRMAVIGDDPVGRRVDAPRQLAAQLGDDGRLTSRRMALIDALAVRVEDPHARPSRLDRLIEVELEGS